MALCLMTFVSGWTSYAARASEIDDAIKLYEDKSYSNALRLLDRLNQSKPMDMSHYYAGLCYQNLNQVQRAEDEFKWVYCQGKDARLRYYSWSALNTLAKYKAHRVVAGHLGVVHQGGSVRINHCGDKNSRMIASDSELQLDETPGVARNDTPAGFYGGGGWQVTVGPSVCGRH